MPSAELKTSATTATTTYLVDGREYAALEDLPEPARRLIEASLRGGSTDLPRNSFTIDGRGYASLDEMPATDRRRFELSQRMIDEAESGAQPGGFRPSPGLIASIDALRDDPRSFERAASVPSSGGLAPGESPRTVGTAGLIVVIVLLLAVIAFLLLR